MNGIVKKLLLFLTVFLPFEDFIYKWLPVSDFIYTILRSAAFETCLNSLLIVFVVGTIYDHRSPIKSKIEVLAAIFVALALLSIQVNDADWIPALVNLKALIRYIALYYIVISLDISEKEAMSFIRVMIFVGLVQAFIGFYQAYEGGPSAFWLPRMALSEIGGIKKDFAIISYGIEKGAVCGAFGHSVSMALYLMIVNILLITAMLYKKKYFSLYYLSSITCISLAIFFTYSRGAIIAICLSTIVIGYLIKNRVALIAIIYSLALIVTLYVFIVSIINTGQVTTVADIRSTYVNPIDNISMIFSGSYVEQSKNSRLWMLRDVGLSIVKSGNLIGYSPDEETAKILINRSSGNTFIKLLNFSAFEDVYWIAIIAYYGLLGFIIFCFMLYTLYKYTFFTYINTKSFFYKQLSISLITIFIVTIPLTFLVRTFEFRSFSYYYWLLSGLVVCEYRRLLLQEKITGGIQCQQRVI